MLFSNEKVAKLINDQFEPAWQSLRPVPRVTIDFGNGTVVKRTLHGNVATYVCTSEGKVLDILPGIYEPTTYMDELQKLSFLYRAYESAGLAGEDLLKRHHRDLAARLARQIRAERDPSAFRGASIFGSERGTRRAIREDAAAAPAIQATTSVESAAMKGSLAEDTQINETTRRLKIHQRLAKTGLVTPDGINRWLYCEVLGTDLDDPYLGLKDLLFRSYPFAAEDEE